MEELLHWLEIRISSSLRPRSDDIKTLLQDYTYRNDLLEFLKNEDVHALYIYFKHTKTSLAASLSPPDSLQNKCICFIKLGTACKLSLENIANNVISVDCAKFPLTYINMVLHQVYLPLLCNDSVMAGAQFSADKIIDILHKFTGNLEIIAGHAEGSIVLPVPSLELLKNTSLVSKHGAVIHILETTIIGWIKQIKVVLKHDPLTEIKTKGQKPGIYEEQDMWKMHIQTLQSITEQLSSVEATDIVSLLEEAKSTYGHSIKAVSQDVKKALCQAKENLSFLKTLLQWYDKMKLASSEKEKQTLFLPMLHSLFLVWKHSSYYHQTKVFLNLLKLMSNEVVQIAGHLIGRDILDAPQAYTLLKEALKLCATFRGTYLDIKVKADEYNTKNMEENDAQIFKKSTGTVGNLRMYEPPQPKFNRKDWFATNQRNLKDDSQDRWVDSPWPLHNATCFQNINMFMERCNDVLDLVETMKHFQILKNVAAIGGAGSSSLDAMVQEIWDMYCVAKKTFVNQIADILTTDKNSPFERVFFDFRTTIKSLEHQLGGVLKTSFHQCPTIASQLRLLEVFEGISRRDVVKDHLKDKDQHLVSMFIEELTQVNDLYLAMANNPPLHINMTPAMSKLLWIKGLHARISEPMAKLKLVSPLTLEGDCGWKLRHLYKETEEELERFRDRHMKSWLAAVDMELSDALKVPLFRSSGLKHDDDDEYLDKIELNLNPDLLVYLREAEYFMGPPFWVKLPESIQSLMKSTDITKFKVLVTRLETVVSKYNEVMKMITDHQMALFEKKLLKSSEILKAGMTFFTWSMDESADYIELAMSHICTDLYTNFFIVTNNYKVITDLSAAWCKANLDIFTCRDFSRGYSITELLIMQRNMEHELENMLVSDGKRIHNIVDESFVASGISEASPAWQDYIIGIDDLIFQGLKKVTISSLAALLNTLLDSEQVPILCIEVQLINNEVGFNPPLDQSTCDTSVMENVEEWLKTFLMRGSCIKALSSAVKVGYQEYMSQDEEALQLIGHVLQEVQKGVLECQAMLETFCTYAYLWKQDVNAEFQNFLQGKQSVKSLTAEQDMNDQANTALNEAERTFILPKDSAAPKSCCPLLEDFDVEISSYKAARDDIQRLPDLQRCKWIQVDFRPIKQVLNAYALKWMWTFTKYLIDQASATLRSLDFFLKRAEPQIESISGDERDTGSFMKMMRLFNEVSAKQVEMEVQFTVLQKTVALLEQHEMELPKDIDILFRTMPTRWNSMKTKVSLAKQRLGPRIQQEADRVTLDLERFQHKLDVLGHDIETSKVYQYSCSSQEAFKVIEHLSIEVQILQNEAKDLKELQELLETTVVDFSILTNCVDLLQNLNIVWQRVDSILSEQNTWKKEVWQNMDTEQLCLRTSQHLKLLQSLPDEVQEWDVYKQTLEAVNIMHLTLPLIEDLSNSAMRTRHWNQLVRQTGGMLRVTAQSLKALTLGDLLAMDLEKHTADVKTTVQRAVRDMTIESSLKNCEEVWLSRVFDLQPHSRVILSKTHNEELASSVSGSHYTKGDISRNATARGGSVRLSRQSEKGLHLSKMGGRGSTLSLYESLKHFEEPGTVVLLKSTDSLFEELEHHQLVLTNIHPYAEAGSFLDEVTKWQKKLQIIETTVQLWLSVQEKWTQLEEAFSTLAFRVAMPREAALFADVHHHFYRLMKSVEENPNILQNCMRRGLESLLEMLNYKLERCQRAVRLNLEQKRLAFPRFYFLSLEDTLNIVCYGYDLEVLSGHLWKLFQHVHSLFYCTSNSGSDSHKVLGVRSYVGEEFHLIEPLECRGPVENWLPQLVNSIKTSLQHYLRAALEHRKRVLTGRKEIHSAGARRVVISRLVSKEEPASDRNNSVTPSLEQESSAIVSGDDERLQRRAESRHWVLGTLSDIAYLSSQIKFSRTFKESFTTANGYDTEKIQGCLKDLTEGIEYAAKILNEIPQEDIQQTSKRASEAERGRNGQDEVLSLVSALSAGDALKLTNHILLLLYQRDVLEKLLSEPAPTWKLSQPLIYDYDDNSMDIHVRVGDSEILYGFEYQGSAHHALITPLTERVFVNVIAAFSTGTNTLCIGPQGSGKKVMVQELCLALGKPLFYFNCTKNTNYNVLQDICKGLAAAGAWIMINGLEQLPESSLTLLAQLLQQIQTAKHCGKETVTLQLEEVPLNTAGACIAPITRGLNGTTHLDNLPQSSKLPSSLLNCFRIVGVGGVSTRFLLEAQLLLKGFSHVAPLAQKLSVMFDSFAKLYKPNLAGSRSLENGEWACLAIPGISHLLNEASTVLKSLQKSHLEKQERPSQELSSNEDNSQLAMEDRAVVTAIHQHWLPQLLQEEAVILRSLMAAEWPNITYTSDAFTRTGNDNNIDGLIPAVIAAKYGCGQQAPSSECTKETSIPSAIIKAIEKCHIFPSNTFVSKVSHLVQLALKYQTVVITGPPGCGKTKCIKTYLETLREEKKKVITDTVFINALQPGHLLGFMDGAWTDGLLPKLLRKYCGLRPVDSNQVNILHLDGEIDDDQMVIMQSLFCGEECFILENNERIRISDSFQLLWELETLADVSPSVLCCMGILAMPDTDNEWKLPIRIWIKTQAEERQQQLQQLADTFLEPSLQFLRDSQILHQPGNPSNRTLRAIMISETNVAEMFCRICTALIDHVPELLPEDIKKYFIFSSIWSFGGWLDAHERTIFSKWWRRHFKNNNTFPMEGQVWDYHVDTDTRQFVRWHDTLSSYFVSHGQSMASESFVHTVHSEPILYLSSLLIMTGCPVLLAGEAGCGKSILTQEVLHSLCSGEVAEMLDLRIPINNSTDPRRLWGCLKDRLEWQHGTLHRPAGNKKLLCLLDDLNLAKVDKNGRQPACEFVRQLLDQEKIFDPSSLKWRTISDIIYLATWNTTTERFSKQRLRLLRHFCVLYCHYPSQDDQFSIFSTILKTHFLPPVTECKAGDLATPSAHHFPGLLSAFTTVTIELQERLRNAFLRTSQRCHYIFTLRDLAKIFRNICLSLDGTSTAEQLMHLWKHECDWEYGHRMSSSVDRSRYQQEFTVASKKVFNEEELQILLSPHQPVFSSIMEDEGGLITTVAKQQDTNVFRRNEKACSTIRILDGYQQTFNLTHTEELLAEALQEYNKVNPRMSITFYKCTVELLSRLTRNLGSPNGSAHTMLCGEGCLRTSSSVARLAAHLSGFTVVQIGSHNNADKKDQGAKFLKSQLVDCYVKAGLKGQKTLLLLSEEEIDSTALAYMTEFVVFGSVAHLFTSEQQATIANAMRNEVTNAGLTYSKENAWKLFLQTVQQNLRWLLIHSSTGPSFHKWCLEFSSLINSINVYFLPQWSRENLVEHASYHIGDLEMLTMEERENVCHLLSSMHISIVTSDKSTQGKYGIITNATFENFVQCFKFLMKEQYNDVIKKHEMAKEALGHIAEKLRCHEKLTDDLLHQKTVLEEHKEGTVKILHQIAQDKAVVEQKIQIVHQQLQKIKKLKTLLPEYQLAHERAKYKCSAILENIKELVHRIDVRALGELRSMQKPDVDIEELMASVIILLKSPNTDLTWAKGAKRQMANIDRFLNELITFSSAKMPQSTLELLEANMKKAQFTPENMERKSGGNVAAGSLMRWLQGAVQYYRILASKVKPLQSKVEEMTIALQEAEQKMTTLQQRKHALILRLSDLERGFEEATVHKNKQQQRTIEISQKLEQAANVAQLLEEEKKKYALVVSSLPERLSGIPGSTAMAAGLVSYLGAYEHNFRQFMLTMEWPMALKEKGLPLMIDSIDPVKGRLVEFSVIFTSESPVENQRNDLNCKTEQEAKRIEDGDNSYPDHIETNLNRLLMHTKFSPIITEELYVDYIKALLRRIVKESDIKRWAAKDWTPQQMENAAILLCSWQRPVLLIDSCFEAEKWVLEILETSLGKSLSCINLQARKDSSVLAPIEKAIISGTPLILNNYSSKWDDLLIPLIDHCSATVDKDNHQDSSSIVSFNGHRLLCSNQFQLFLAPAELEPCFNNDISAGTTIINYDSSEGSLLELLLRRAFQKLQPDHHRQLMKISNFIMEQQQTLEELDIKTRECISSSALNNLDDTDNLTAIFEKKRTVFKVLEEAKSDFAGLLVLRDKLYPLAHQGAQFYVILKSLRSLAAEYYFSIDFFLKLFDFAIGRMNDSHEDNIQVANQDLVNESLAAPYLQGTNPELHVPVDLQHQKQEESEDTVPDTGPDRVESCRTAGVYGFSLSFNQIRKLMDQLTQAVYQSLIQSLLPEHSTQACALLFLCKQQLEDGNAFTEEELAFFVQGSCTFDKTKCEKLHSNLNPPSWLPSEKWENVTVLSTISAPLGSLYAQVSENSSIWESWYNSDCWQAESADCTSGKETAVDTVVQLPDCGNAGSLLSDFHQLLVLQALRPEHTPEALARYVAKSSSELAFEDFLPGVEEISRLEENMLGILVLLPSTKSCSLSYSGAIMSHKPKIAISNAAKKKNIPLFIVSMRNDNEGEVKSTLTDAMSQNGWLMIENLHLASKNDFKNLYRSLTYATKMQVSQKEDRRFCVWLMYECGASIPQTLLARLKKVSWHIFLLNQISNNIWQRDIAFIDSLPRLLSLAIMSALDHFEELMTENMNESPPLGLKLCFGVCIIHGIIQTQKLYPRTGLNNVMDIGSVQLNQALTVVLSACKENKMPDEVAGAVKDGVTSIYANHTWRPEDTDYVEALVQEVVSSILNQEDLIVIDNLTIPIPPADVKPSQYSSWLADRMPSNCSMKEQLLPRSADKSVKEKFSLGFMQSLATVYDAMKISLPLYKPGDMCSRKDMALLHTSLERISEQLPPLIQVDESDPPSNNFLNNRVAEGELQVSKCILLQECRQMNAYLRHIKLSISELSSCLMTGLIATHTQNQKIAEALLKGEVPQPWFYSHGGYSESQTITSWLQDLHKKHTQLKQWMKKGLMPFAKGEKGALTSVRLGGLFDPEALILALRVEFAAHHRYPLHEVVLQCRIAEYPDYKPDTEGYPLYIENPVLYGATWDYKNNHLIESRDASQLLPFVIITPVHGKHKDHGQEIYECPVYMDSTMQNCVMRLPLTCTKPVRQWNLRRVAIILNPGIDTTESRTAPYVNVLANVPVINTRTKMYKSSHSNIFSRASKGKAPVSTQTQQPNTPGSNDAFVINNTVVSDKDHSNALLEDVANVMTSETKLSVMSPLFTNETLSDQQDEESFREDTPAHQKVTISDNEAGKWQKGRDIERKGIVVSEGCANKAEEAIIDNDSMVHTRISAYEPSYNEHGHGHNNGNFDEAENKSYKEAFDKERGDSFQESLPSGDDFETSENQASYNYGSNNEDNKEHIFDYNVDSRWNANDNTGALKDHSIKIEADDIRENIQ
ncbi:dynein axonemal heavy chain 9-like [Spea bombifrons]|uniref:dynein axonemal heavy chain 9-like n=1 Tax=Spea bombifrons TaxID=233779 RepID=UPI00234A9DCB|nr:dynein axonemal heavy chain 9-like [Spea bombifrons]